MLPENKFSNAFNNSKESVKVNEKVNEALDKPFIQIKYAILDLDSNFEVTEILQEFLVKRHFKF